MLDSERIHVHAPRSASRLPKVSTVGSGPRVHRRALLRSPHPDDLAVSVLDALYDSVLCQAPRAAIATLDSALHHGLIDDDELDELFDALPRRYRRIRGLLDARAESGPESLMRLLLRSIGCVFVPQVEIAGVGRVDFLVDGWLIIECDSRAHHSEWASQRRDRRRDQAAAALGYATYRPLAEDLMWHQDAVRAAVVGLRRVTRVR